MATKLIGITGFTSEEKTVLNTAYISALTRPGITPLIIPELVVRSREFLDADSFAAIFGEHIAEMTGRLDALVVSGGRDINPVTFNESNGSSSGCNSVRDYMELALIDAFVKANKPILGICRGHQLIGRYLKLSGFKQDLPAEAGHHDGKALDFTRRQEPLHYVYIRGGFRDYLRDKTEREDMSVIHTNSYHHQGFIYTGGMKKSKAEKDWTWMQNRANEYEVKHQIDVLGHTSVVLEAFKCRELPIMCVQWHCEEAGPEGMTIQYWLDTMVK